MDSRDKSMTIIKTTKILSNLVKAIKKQYCVSFILFSLLSTSQAVSAQQVTIKQALNDVGIKKLPAFIVVSDNAIGLHFPAKFGGHKLTFTGSVDADALKDKKFVFTSSEKGKIDWKNAFFFGRSQFDTLLFFLHNNTVSFYRFRSNRNNWLFLDLLLCLIWVHFRP